MTTIGAGYICKHHHVWYKHSYVAKNNIASYQEILNGTLQWATAKLYRLIDRCLMSWKPVNAFSSHPNKDGKPQILLRTFGDHQCEILIESRDPLVTDIYRRRKFIIPKHFKPI